MAANGVAYETANPFEVDRNGVPLAGGQLFSYVTGTTTPLQTFQDPGLTVPNPNPLIADANGRFGSVWLSPSTAYKIQLFSASTPDNPGGTEIWSRDPFGPAAGGSISNTAGIIGEIRAFAGIAAAVPAQWLLCYGQAVSRTTFASLFAVLGTSWGAGDGSTTFNLPDLRGRAMFGKDDMGGTPASRLTAGVSGVAGATLGAVGGSQSTQDHNHTLTDPTHTHTVVDPMHDHVQNLPNPAVSGGGQVLQQFDGLHGGSTWSISTETASTGITLDPAATGITLATYGAGSSQNVPPAGVVQFILYAGA
jgi:microcystin-dependent protein